MGTRPQYDFGARRMSPSYGRFTTMDPLGEKYYHLSPYAYCAGDSVNYVDFNEQNARTLAHEIGHTLGLLDNNPNVKGSLMDYPASPLSVQDVETIVRNAYVKKKNHY